MLVFDHEDMNWCVLFYLSVSQVSVGSDRGPGYHHVVRLAQRLVEVGRRGYVSISEVEEIVGLWESLPEADKGPVNYPPRYSVVDNSYKRYVSCWLLSSQLVNTLDKEPFIKSFIQYM